MLKCWVTVQNCVGNCQYENWGEDLFGFDDDDDDDDDGIINPEIESAKTGGAPGLLTGNAEMINSNIDLLYAP